MQCSVKLLKETCKKVFVHLLITYDLSLMNIAVRMFHLVLNSVAMYKLLHFVYLKIITSLNQLNARTERASYFSQTSQRQSFWSLHEQIHN